MTTKILTIYDPMDCPYNKNYRTNNIVPTSGSRTVLPDSLRDVKICSKLSNFPEVIYCDCRERGVFPKQCPLKTYEEGGQ